MYFFQMTQAVITIVLNKCLIVIIKLNLLTFQKVIRLKKGYYRWETYERHQAQIYSLKKKQYIM